MPMRSRIPVTLFAATLIILSIAGCSSGPKPLALEFRVAEDSPGEGLSEMYVPLMDRSVYVHPDAAIDAAHIDTAVVYAQDEHFLVDLQFTAAGTAAMTELTAANIGKRIAILVDGEVVSAPICRAAITAGRAVINGDFGEAEATRIADGLNRR